VSIFGRGDYINTNLVISSNIIKTILLKKQCSLKIKGISMEPLIHDEEEVKIEKPNKLRCGDIIVFNHKKRGLVVHRIISISNTVIIAKGDNAIKSEIINFDDVIGRVVSIKTVHKKEILIKIKGIHLFCALLSKNTKGFLLKRIPYVHTIYYLKRCLLKLLMRMYRFFYLYAGFTQN
jgi:signal peptidase I